MLAVTSLLSMAINGHHCETKLCFKRIWLLKLEKKTLKTLATKLLGMRHMFFLSLGRF